MEEVEQPKTPIRAPKGTIPNKECQRSRKGVEKKDGFRLESPTGLTSDMVNHMFHLQVKMRKYQLRVTSTNLHLEKH